jgi:hypothetical protein
MTSRGGAGRIQEPGRSGLSRAERFGCGRPLKCEREGTLNFALNAPESRACRDSARRTQARTGIRSRWLW